ncbi:hypothetical protein [Dyadobacter sp. CY312]|uniref:hypothetical protein n=1 Tax=Dyadobacter sp. CY312 TaxID=2907303 RepID=UPI001F1BCB6F|nr:hypothetical protein [Dyadobacter sp. CY312]
MISNIAADGGMAKKYKHLVDKLSAHPSAYIKNQGTNDLLIVSEGRTTHISFYLMENFGTLEVEWLADYGPTGQLQKKWKFPSNASQQSMVEEIESYVVMKTSQLLRGGVIPL